MADIPDNPIEADYHKVANGGVLKRLPNGLLVVRRFKHEWTRRLEGLPPAAFAMETSPKRGSKFLKAWNLSFYVQWVEEQLQALQWTEDTPQAEHTVELDHPVGYSNGKLVNTIRIELSSRNVHAYPVGEE